MKMGTMGNTFNDVICYEADTTFAKKTVNFDSLAVDVTPGSCITSGGAAYESGDDCLLVVCEATAGTDVPVVVADRGIIIKASTVLSVMGDTIGALAITALTSDGAVRVAQTDAE